MFIRIKNINKQKYAYLVENDWTKKGSRQKVKKYLGKIIKLEKEKEIKKLDFEKIKKRSFEKITLILVEKELLEHGFLKKEKSKYESEYTHGDIIASINTKSKIFSLNKKKKNIVLEFNEGFLCPDSVNELIKLNGYGKEEQVGLRLANALVECGIKTPKEIFITLFNKKFRRLD